MLFCRREEDEMKKIADANRREKLETQQAKQRAIDQIEADKRARKAKAEAEKSGIAIVETAKPQHVAAPAPTRQYDECNLQVRLPDGSTIRQTFKAADTFEKVVEWIRSKQSSVPFVLLQNYPKKEFQESDNHKSLADLGRIQRGFLRLFSSVVDRLGLVPSGSLMMKQLTHFQT